MLYFLHILLIFLNPTFFSLRLDIKTVLDYFSLHLISFLFRFLSFYSLHLLIKLKKYLIVVLPDEGESSILSSIGFFHIILNLLKSIMSSILLTSVSLVSFDSSMSEVLRALFFFRSLAVCLQSLSKHLSLIFWFSFSLVNKVSVGSRFSISDTLSFVSLKSSSSLSFFINASSFFLVETHKNPLLLFSLHHLSCYLSQKLLPYLSSQIMFFYLFVETRTCL
jgi:hypothetical protein